MRSSPRALSRHLPLLGPALAALGLLSGCPPASTPSGTPGDNGASQRVGEVTWHRDVSPIVQRSCAGCHRTDGMAPFSLQSFAQALTHKDAMASAATSRRMPPWPPSADCQPLRDARVLEPREIDVLAAWAAQGGPEGNPADAPAPSTPAPGLSEVSATLSPAGDYTPKSDVPDDYHCLVLDPALAADRDLVGFEIVPGAPKLVHHVLLYSAKKADAQARDDAEAGLGWTCYGGPGTANPKVLGGWVPGTPPTRFPETTGITLAAGSVIVMQIHYNTQTSPPGPDRTQVKLQYSPSPVPRPAIILPVAESSFVIPPNSSDITASRSVASIPGTLWGVLPHMHVRGKSTRVDYGSTCVIDIPRWQFGWQQFYFLAAPTGFPLTAGTNVKVSCTWDNPTAKTVRWGEGTDDEMCITYFYVTN